jgi:hypothetical protein
MSHYSKIPYEKLSYVFFSRTMHMVIHKHCGKSKKPFGAEVLRDIAQTIG